MNAPQNELPCASSSRECVGQLTAAALHNSEAARVLDRAIKLNKTKLWTNYLSANSLNVFSLVLQTARNVAGGGDVAQAKLTTAQLRVQRLAIEDALRSTIMQHVTDYEAADLRERTIRTQLRAQTELIQIAEVSYRRGDSTTEQMIQVWTQDETLRAQFESAKADESKAFALLREVVSPSRIGTPQK